MAKTIAAFWSGFKDYFEAEPLQRPMPAGVAACSLPVRPHLLERDVGNIGAWVPRSFLRNEGKQLVLRGRLISVIRINRRVPGLLRTIELLERVNPGARIPENEIRLIILAVLHAAIARNFLSSSCAHDIGLYLGEGAGIDPTEGGWSSKIRSTLPVELPNLCFDNETPWAIGRFCAQATGSLYAGFRPVRLHLTAAHFGGFDEHDVIRLRESLPGDLVRPPGTLSWQMMTPQLMQEMVWIASITDLAVQYQVSDRTIRTYCRLHALDMPNQSYWRMSPGNRALVMAAMPAPGADGKIDQAPAAQASPDGA